MGIVYGMFQRVELKQTLICPACGSEIPPGHKCAYCPYHNYLSKYGKRKALKMAKEWVRVNIYGGGEK